jgi:deoxyribodipyrimidine photo-lyase
MTDFTPTRAAALRQLSAVDAEAYARSRNYLEGAVTRLSPYLTHGLLRLREVYSTVHSRQPLEPHHKLVFELGWRAYYRHVWAHRGEGILQSFHEGVLPDETYATQIPDDIRQARTGVPVIDLAVRSLYESGYLHNHARMWLASYMVHLRKVHWLTGAHWMLGYLLDGDLASNSLSWQWIAGTGSVKPYVFNADNVAKYAPAPWHSDGTLLDTSYDTLNTMAQTSQAFAPALPLPVSSGMDPPDLYPSPHDCHADISQAWESPDAADPELLRGRDVWLHHPWALHVDPDLAPHGAVHVGVGFAACQARTPWSAQRWRFVTQGLQAVTAQRWWGSPASMAMALGQARSVRWHPDGHADRSLEELATHLRRHTNVELVDAVEPPDLFSKVTQPCRSFASWWKQAELAL